MMSRPLTSRWLAWAVIVWMTAATGCGPETAGGKPTDSSNPVMTAGGAPITARSLTNADNGLEIRKWVIADDPSRIAAAIERLSTQANVSVKQLASDLGYASVPAFSHAFRQVTGKTPTKFSTKD